MKKTTLFCLGFVFILLACDTDGYEPNQPADTNSTTADNNLQTKAVATDLSFITQQLTDSYLMLVDDTDSTLAQKIMLLDSVSLSVPSFTAIKPQGFALPTTTEAGVFLTAYVDSYSNLNLSSAMISYLDELLQTEDVDYIGLIDTIQADLVLTSQEKIQLHFIVTYLSDNTGGPIIDGSWKKKNIIAAIKGFEKSSANAVFNVALVKITQQ